jgi:2-succinyl-6-hydroxy-2,4-cyclohexadiene-1-carboxylate synthase
VVIRTLSGFLGLPSDWDFLPWPHSPDSGDVLLGYSMGGRLALRLLERGCEFRVAGSGGSYAGAIRGVDAPSETAPATRNPQPAFKKAIIVSTGLNAPDEERRKRDEIWARRFESEEWQSLMRAWNAQPVFGGHTLERREADYDRHELARQLRDWSPAALPPPNLERIETPILWIAGERDARYVDIARRAVERLPNAELWICPGAGHRVPWEQPQAFVARLQAFLA